MSPRRQGDPFGRRGDPFGRRRDPFGRRKNPYIGIKKIATRYARKFFWKQQLKKFLRRLGILYTTHACRRLAILYTTRARRRLGILYTTVTSCSQSRHHRHVI